MELVAGCPRANSHLLPAYLVVFSGIHPSVHRHNHTIITASRHQLEVEGRIQSGVNVRPLGSHAAAGKLCILDRHDVRGAVVLYKRI